jgi:hypothetical protein
MLGALDVDVAQQHRGIIAAMSTRDIAAGSRQLPPKHSRAVCLLGSVVVC